MLNLLWSPDKFAAGDGAICDLEPGETGRDGLRLQVLANELIVRFFVGGVLGARWF